MTLPSRLSALVLLVVVVGSIGCGSSGSSSPTSPSSSTDAQLTVPTGVVVLSQKVNAASNDIQLFWSGNGTSYLVKIGTTSGASNTVATEVTGTTYTWQTPRAAGVYYASIAAKRGDSVTTYSTEIQLTVVDVRNIIDALFFDSGPMAQTPSNANATPIPVASVWASGTALRILVSSEAGTVARTNAQTFADQFAATSGNLATGTTQVTDDTMKTTAFETFPEFTIGVRVLANYCANAAIACAFYGPRPVGPNRSMVTMVANGLVNAAALAHEMGHAYGMSHVVPVPNNADLRFMMSPSGAGEQMTAAEKLAISLAIAGGIRGGTTRAQAIASGLVNPYTGSVSSIRRLPSSARTDHNGWIEVSARR